MKMRLTIDYDDDDYDDHSARCGCSFDECFLLIYKLDCQKNGQTDSQCLR